MQRRSETSHFTRTDHAAHARRARGFRGFRRAVGPTKNERGDAYLLPYVEQPPEEVTTSDGMHARRHALRNASGDHGGGSFASYSTRLHIPKGLDRSSSSQSQKLAHKACMGEKRTVRLHRDSPKHKSQTQSQNRHPGEARPVRSASVHETHGMRLKAELARAPSSRRQQRLLGPKKKESNNITPETCSHGPQSVPC